MGTIERLFMYKETKIGDHLNDRNTVILVAHLASILSVIIEPHCKRQTRQCTTAESSYAVHDDKTLHPQHGLRK